jgi:hypothetical protein
LRQLKIVNLLANYAGTPSPKKKQTHNQAFKNKIASACCMGVKHNKNYSILFYQQ